MSHEECGVFGIYAPEQPVAELTYKALLALQHRGQDAAGIAVSDGQAITVMKDAGLVDMALQHGQSLTGFAPGDFASGHVRYSTHHTANSHDNFKAAQPMFNETGDRPFALSQNGHTINSEELERHHSSIDAPITDGELITQLVAGAFTKDRSLTQAIGKACNVLNGAYSLVVMGQQELIGVRDPRGFRPLMLGSIGDKGTVIASERSALDIVQAQYVREVEPGEVVRVDADGQLASTYPFDSHGAAPSLCAFEYVYFSRPDNELYGENVEQVRFRMGQELAREAPADGDIVVGVPNSGISSAHGFVDVSQIPMQQGLTKNNYISRTFIAATQPEREAMTRLKLNANKPIIDGHRVVAVDDSIIRSTTTKAIVAMLREAGAKEVHLRISSPPYKWPCFYGMNTGDINELVAATKTTEEICRDVGADSLEYISEEAFRRSLGKAAAKVCMACITGDYPTEVPLDLLQLAKDGVH